MNKILARLAIAAVTLVAAFSFANSAAATPSDAITCDVGSYSSTGYASVSEGVTCLLTPPGTYQNQPGATAPIVCPAGTFAAFYGLIACLQSESGRYAPVNSVVALPCHAGTYSGPGQGACTLASAGHYVADIQSASQAECALGTYQPLTEQTACLPAPAGTYVATTGATSYTDCPIDKTTATSGATSAADCNISTLVTILVSPSPTATPTPAPTAAPVVMPAPTPTHIPVDLRVQNVAGLKIPKSVKVGAKFSFGKVIPAGLAVKASASGSCKVSTSASGYNVTAAKAAGVCKLTLTNQGNGTFMPVNTQVLVKVLR